MNKLRRQVFLVLFVLSVFRLGADETNDGFIRMLVNEKTGRFELSYLTDAENSKYSRLFYKNGKTSFFDVNIDGRSYRLGESGVFSTKVEKGYDGTVVSYDSKKISVTVNFSTVRTVSSSDANGIRITVQITNNGEDEPKVGLRLLIDTSLGEGRKNIPFVTENLNITKEKIIEGFSAEKYWISKGKDLSLMGSISDPLDENAVRPDYLHFANWKKLSDVPWKASYHEGSSFNKMPYSIGDSAVSYYWEPVVLETGNKLTYTVYLTTEDAVWYDLGLNAAPVKPAAPKPPEIIPETVEPAAAVEPEERPDSSETNMAIIEKEAQEISDKTGEDYNVVVLRMLQNVLNRFIAGEISLNELDILQIDLAVERYGPKQ